MILIISARWLPWWFSGKEDLALYAWVRKIPWRRKWQLTQVFLPGKSYGQKSLVGFSL